MRILVVTHNYPRFPGDPAGAFVAQIARAATRRSVVVQVIAPHAPGTATTEMDDAVEVRRFRYAPDRLERVAYTGDLHRRTLFSPLPAIVFPAFLFAFRRAVRRSVATFTPDLVHAHWWFPGGWVAAGTGLPFIITCHGSDVRLLERHRSLRRFARPLFRRAGAVTAVSRFLAADLAGLLEMPSERILALRMPVDVDHFAAGAALSKLEPPRILYAGNLVPSKGVDVLLDAYALLKRRGIPCQLKVLGEGPATDALHRHAASLGLTDVEWSGFVGQEAMPSEYGRSTVTVLPTRGQAEGLGLALVEALLAGCAVIGTQAGGIPEVIQDGETGLLVKDGDAEDLARALELMLCDAPLRRRLSAEGERRVRALHAPDATVEPFLRLYDDVVERRAST